MKLKFPFACLWAALCCVAHADVKYTETMTMSGQAATAGPPMRSTTYLKAGLERTEQAISMGPVSMKMVAVSSCPAKRTMRFDAGLKIYTSSPLYGETSTRKDEAKTTDKAPAEPKPDKKTGKITMTADVKKLGIEEVAGRKARHYLIDQRMTPEGCAGKDETNFKMEVWTADYDMPVFACRSPWMSGAASAATLATDGCSITSEFKGDQTALAEAYRGLVVKRKMVMGETVMTWQLTELSEAKLDDALFTPPADWKLVSDEEFDKKRQAEMMRAMMNDGGADGDKDADDDAPAPGAGESPAADDAAGDDGKAKDSEAADDPDKGKKKKKKIKLPF